MIVEIELDERDTVACNVLADAIDEIGFLSAARAIRAVVDTFRLTPATPDRATAGANGEETQTRPAGELR